MSGTRGRNATILAGSAVAALALLPSAYLAFRTFGTAGLDGLSRLTDAKIVPLVARTVLLSGAVTATAIAIAFPLAWIVVRTNLPARRAIFVASSLPLVIPSFVGAYAFVAAFGPRGLVQGWLEPLGVGRLPSIYGFAGAWLVLSLFTYPLALLPLRAAIEGLDRSLEEVSRALGRSRTQTLLRVTLPQLRPALTSGALLVSLYVASDFGAVSLMRFRSLTFEIHLAYRTFDYDGAAVLGALLALLTGLVLVAEVRSRSRAVYHPTHRGLRRRASLVDLQRWKWPAFAFASLVVFIALVVPVGVISIWLVRAIASGASFSSSGLHALRSIEASFLGAAATVLCAWPIALIAARHRTRFAKAIEASSYAGYALPGIVIALALVFFGIRTGFLYQTIGLLVVAYAVHFLPQAMGPLRTSIEQVHPGVEEAARSLGASPGEVVRRVMWPLVRPGAATAFALVFLTVMKELPATLLLAPTGFRTLATQVWDKASAASFGEAALPALALVVLSSVPMALLVTRGTERIDA